MHKLRGGRGHGTPTGSGVPLAPAVEQSCTLAMMRRQTTEARGVAKQPKCGACRQVSCRNIFLVLTVRAHTAALSCRE